MSKIFKCFSTKEWLFLVLTLALLGIHVYCSLTLPEYMGAIVGNLQDGAIAGDLSLFWSDILKNGGILGCLRARLEIT